MDKLVESLMEELNCNTVFTIPLFGGIPVLESVVVTRIIMAIMMIGSLILVKGLKMRNIGKKQAALESGFTFLYRFFGDLLGEDGKAYIPYLITVMLYIAIANMIGLLGFKSPTKDLNVTASLAVMSIVLGGGSGNPETGLKRMAQKLCGADSDHCADQCTGTVYPAAFPLYSVVRKRAWCRCCHGADQVSASGGGSASVQRIFRYI